MPGIKKLRKLQMGREATAGTAVAATTLWRGEGTIEDQREIMMVEEDVGYLSGLDRTYTPKYMAALAMDAVEATFEQFPHILEAGVRTDTPDADGTGSGYVYEYVFPTTALNTLKYYTIEGGDNQAAEEMEYSFVQDFTLSGEAAAGIEMSASWVGRQVSTSLFTTGVSMPDVDVMIFGKSELYIDAVAGSIGGTQKTSTFLAASLDVDTGWRPVFTGDGELYYTFVKNIGPVITLDVTFEHDGTATAEIAAKNAETPRQIRWKIEGPALGTAGTYTYKTVMVDLAGKWESFDKIGDQDGNDIVTGRFVARYNSTADLFAEITVVNELSALP